MLKNYKELKIWQKSYFELKIQIMLSGSLDYIGREIVETVMDKISEVQRMLKGLIKSLEEKHLNP